MTIYISPGLFSTGRYFYSVMHCRHPALSVLSPLRVSLFLCTEGIFIYEILEGLINSEIFS